MPLIKSLNNFKVLERILQCTKETIAIEPIKPYGLLTYLCIGRNFLKIYN